MALQLVLLMLCVYVLLTLKSRLLLFGVLLSAAYLIMPQLAIRYYPVNMYLREPLLLRFASEMGGLEYCALGFLLGAILSGLMLRVRTPAGTNKFVLIANWAESRQALIKRGLIFLSLIYLSFGFLFGSVSYSGNSVGRSSFVAANAGMVALGIVVASAGFYLGGGAISRGTIIPIALSAMGIVAVGIASGQRWIIVSLLFAAGVSIQFGSKKPLRLLFAVGAMFILLVSVAGVRELRGTESVKLSNVIGAGLSSDARSRTVSGAGFVMQDWAFPGFLVAAAQTDVGFPLRQVVLAEVAAGFPGLNQTSLGGLYSRRINPSGVIGYGGFFPLGSVALLGAPVGGFVAGIALVQLIGFAEASARRFSNRKASNALLGLFAAALPLLVRSGPFASIKLGYQLIIPGCLMVGLLQIHRGSVVMREGSPDSIGVR
jgi:hypothetical protein